MNLFSDKARANDSVKNSKESDFEFFDRSSWPSMERVRNILQACLDGFADDDRPDLIARVRSGDARHFRSATTELLIHEFLRRQGFRLSAHPGLPNGSAKRPDFLVTSAEGRSIYLEVVGASEDDGDDVASEARKNETLRVLEQTLHPTFTLDMHTSGNPATQASGRRLADAILRWLDGLDADALLAGPRPSLEELPKFEWRHENWHLSFRAIPRPKKARSKPARLIGIRSVGAHVVDGWTPIRDAVLQKASKYGVLDKPLVVAVNVNAFDLDEIDELQALFGQEQFVFGPTHTGARLQRAPNGAWIGPKGLQYTRCSGAWFLGDLRPYSIAKVRQTLYLHPAPRIAVPEEFLCMPSALVVGEELVRKPGKSFAEVFEISNSWPEQD